MFYNLLCDYSSYNLGQKSWDTFTKTPQIRAFPRGEGGGWYSPEIWVRGPLLETHIVLPDLKFHTLFQTRPLPHFICLNI